MTDRRASVGRKVYLPAAVEGCLIVCMRLTTMVSLLAALASGRVANAEEGRRLAVVVGVDDYQDSTWPALRFAAKDAGDMAGALSASFQRVLQLKEDEPPTRSAVLRLLDELDEANTSDLDTVLVYISAHGTLARDAGGDLGRVLVLHDTDSNNLMTTGLPYDDLLARLEPLRSKHKVVILAACHAGTGKSVLAPALREELRGLKGAFFAEPSLPVGEGRLVLAASAWGEPAREDDTLENDIYTHFFIEALGGLDRNGDGAISALEAHDFARSRTMEFTQNRQRPTLSAEIVGDDPIVLIGRRERVGEPVIAAYGRAFEGARLEIDGRYKGDFPGGFVVSPGARRVRVALPGAVAAVFDREVEIHRDEPMLLDELVQSDPLRFVPGVAFAWQVTHGEVAEEYLPGFPRVDLSLELTRPGHRWRAGLLLGGTLLDQSIRVRSGRHETAARQELRLLHASVDVAAGVWRWSWVVVLVRARGGWSFGDRHVDLPSVVPRRQKMSFASAGGGIEVELWPLHPIGVRVRSDLQLLLMSVEGDIRPVASQVHGIHFLWAL